MSFENKSDVCKLSESNAFAVKWDYKGSGFMRQTVKLGFALHICQIEGPCVKIESYDDSEVEVIIDFESVIGIEFYESAEDSFRLNYPYIVFLSSGQHIDLSKEIGKRLYLDFLRHIGRASKWNKYKSTEDE